VLTAKVERLDEMGGVGSRKFSLINEVYAFQKIEEEKSAAAGASAETMKVTASKRRAQCSRGDLVSAEVRDTRADTNALKA
jgi:hypothetical protein